MDARKIDMDTVRFYLRGIAAAFSLIMDDIEREHHDTKEYSVLFYNRVGGVYIPSMNFLCCSMKDLLDSLEDVEP